MVSPVGSDDAQLEVMQQEEREAFESEEARLDFLRARRRRRLFWSVLAAVLLLGCGHIVIRKMGWYGHRDGSGSGGRGRSAPLKIDPIGDPKAKVRIECIVPSGSDCHDPVIKLLQGVAKKRPDRFRVDFEAMENMSDKTITAKVGEVCAGIVINGQRQFDIETPGGARHVKLIGTAPSHFSLYDLADALKQVYVQEYGPVEGGPLVDLPPQPKTACRRRGGGQQTKKEHDKKAGTEVPLELPPSLNVRLAPAPAKTANTPGD